MGRYVKDVQLDKPIDVVSMVMDDFVYHNQFSRTDWNGEMVYYLKDRHGGERYMKWSYAAGELHVEAWLKNPFGGEMDLDGVGGGASRREYRKSMDELIRRLVNTGDQLSSGHVGSDPLHHDNSHHTGSRFSAGAAGQGAAAPKPSASDTESGSIDWSKPPAGMTPSMMWLVLAFVFSWSFSVLGIIFAAVALRRRKECSRPEIVKVLAIFAIVIAIGRLLYVIVASIAGIADLWGYYL